MLASGRNVSVPLTAIVFGFCVLPLLTVLICVACLALPHGCRHLRYPATATSKEQQDDSDQKSIDFLAVLITALLYIARWDKYQEAFTLAQFLEDTKLSLHVPMIFLQGEWLMNRGVYVSDIRLAPPGTDHLLEELVFARRPVQIVYSGPRSSSS